MIKTFVVACRRSGSASYTTHYTKAQMNGTITFDHLVLGNGVGVKYSLGTNVNVPFFH